MESVEKRALDFAVFWYSGGNPEDAEEDEMRAAKLSKEIERMLKEQDRFTRHAIAEKLVCDTRAHGIAMNIQAV